jgi:hypothetical protein
MPVLAAPLPRLVPSGVVLFMVFGKHGPSAQGGCRSRRRRPRRAEVVIGEASSSSPSLPLQADFSVWEAGRRRRRNQINEGGEVLDAVCTSSLETPVCIGIASNPGSLKWLGLLRWRCSWD